MPSMASIAHMGADNDMSAIRSSPPFHRQRALGTYFVTAVTTAKGVSLRVQTRTCLTGHRKQSQKKTTMMLPSNTEATIVAASIMKTKMWSS